ncbi:MAG: hypothetical protein LE178_05430 [Endomicrobium sp.]|nr:hypothetical protein [Endomicrobium sp.]
MSLIRNCGRGACQQPVASVAVSDGVNISKFIVTNTAGIMPDVVYDKKIKIVVLPAGKSKVCYYLRFVVLDESDVLSKFPVFLANLKFQLEISLNLI